MLSSISIFPGHWHICIDNFRFSEPPSKYIMTPSGQPPQRYWNFVTPLRFPFDFNLTPLRSGGEGTNHGFVITMAIKYFKAGLPLSCMSCQKKKCWTFGRTFSRTCRTFGRTFWKDIGKTFLVNLMACASDLWIKFNYSACSVRFSNCFFHFLPFFYFKFQLKKVDLRFYLKE